MCIVAEQRESYKYSVNDRTKMVFISEHAFDRMKKRNGWKRKTALRMVKKIYDNGSRVSEAKGRARQYMKKRLENRPSDDIVLYGDYLYIFDNKVLVTAFSINNVLQATEERLSYL